ncbi:hypothetical protein HK104_000775, partial [Borealophlyctis nickersoniae]
VLTINDGSTIHWKLDKTYITEAPNERTGILGALSRGTLQGISLLEALQVLKWAKDDQRIKGLVVDLSTAGVVGRARPQLGFAQVQELRDAIKEFAEAKKQQFGEKNYKLTAYTDTFESQLLYYLATAFDEVQMEPLGNIPLIGLATQAPFVRTLLDRLGVRVRAHSRGEFKSVTSPFTETDWPLPQIENLSDMLGSLNDQLVKGIATSRARFIRKFEGIKAWMEEYQQALPVKTPKDGEPPYVDPVEAVAPTLDDGATLHKAKIKKPSTSPEEQKVRDLMDLAPLHSAESLEAGLVDKVTYKRTMIPRHSRDPKEKHKDTDISFTRYRVARGREVVKKNALEAAAGVPKATIGLVYLVGMINRGDGQFGASTVAKAIDDAAKNQDVGAILLRIDSGGGDVIGSETIWEAVQHAQTEHKKPVIASYGNISASGGYYCSAHCSKILANPGTITGSIGVASGRPVITKTLLTKLGINVSEIAFSEGIKSMSVFHDLDHIRLYRFIKFTDEMYEIFLSRVMKGRKMEPGRVALAAGGRVWSGEQAKSWGLVDQLGGLRAATKLATDACITIPPPPGIEPVVEIRLFPPPKSFWDVMTSRDPDELLGALGEGMRAGIADIAREMLGGLVARGVQELETKGGVSLKEGQRFQMDEIDVK